jgi:CRISPR-associated protein Csx17
VPELRLPGCRTQPLLGYLKGLGLLRVVARQADPEARARWSGDVLELSSCLDRDSLSEFLLRSYSPTPILSPWNGRSGFYVRGNSTAVGALKRIESSDDERLGSYRAAISVAREVLARLGVEREAW